VVSKMKVGDDVEIEGVKKPALSKGSGEAKPREGTVIELNINEILSEEG